MPMYAVSYINFYDNELTTKFIEADNEFSALRSKAIARGIIEESEDVNTVEEIKQFAFDCDSMINAVEVPNK